MLKLILAAALAAATAPTYAGQGGLAPNYSGERYTPPGPPQPYGREAPVPAPALTAEQIYNVILTCQMHEHDPGFARTANCDEVLKLLPRQ